MAAFRRMLAVSLRDKIRNFNIQERLGVKETLVQLDCQRQHSWLCHVWRMNNERIAKFALEGKVDEQRRVGKRKYHGCRLR